VKRSIKLAAALSAAALSGAVVAVALRGTPAPAVPSPPALSTATIVRTDLASTVLAPGTLGYTPSAPVVNGLSGTYTSVPATGTVVQPGQTLFRVDNGPVVLMHGTVPVWRAFTPGMSDGPDVAELESNLIALGDAQGLLSAAGSHYGPAAIAAVQRWQTSLGEPGSGMVPLGAVVFLPTAVRVGAVSVAPGMPASPGGQPYTVTTTTRAASVPLGPADPTVTVGQAVSITLPDGSATPGAVTAVGPPPPTSGENSSGSGGGSGSSAATAELTVTPADAATTGAADGEPIQVSLTVQAVRHVLAVPVAALLALAGGGYGLEVVDTNGHHHLVGVRTGIFAGGRVQVSGEGIGAGTRVAVAQ
jgi:hypothetical protein